jgi:hypothetical protein
MYVILDILSLTHDYKFVMKNTINPIIKAGRRYFIEMGISTAALIAVDIFWIIHGANGHWRIVIPLLMMIPTACMFASIVRFVLHSDELYRKVLIESLAIAGGATALIAMAYSFLEGVGFPKQHAIWTFLTFMIGFTIAQYFVARRYYTWKTE